MKTINKQRFLNLLRWEIVTYKKDYRSTFLFFSAGLLLMLLLASGYITTYHDFEFPLYFGRKAKAMAEAMMIFGMVGVATTAFGNMKTNRERLAFLMLPASKAEKFLVRTACRLAMFFFLILAAILAATFLFALLCLVRTGDFAWVISPLGIINDIILVDDSLLGSAVFLLSIVGTWTTYILGSAYFRRRALVFTTLSMGAFSMIVSVLLGIASVHIYKWMESMGADGTITIEFLVEPERLFMWTLFALLLLWNGFCVWASYRLFSKMQVINNRWNNKLK